MTLLFNGGLLLFRVLIAFANKAYVASSALNIAILNLLLIEFVQLPQALGDFGTALLQRTD
jgi:hypothetical protein